MVLPRVKHSWLRALGREDLPSSITLPDGEYRHLRTYKHDFFAATGLYEGPGGKVILKVGRTAGLLGLPMAWLGRLHAAHESRLYRELDGLEGIPRWLGRYGPTGFVHAFVEGHPLQRDERPDDRFFDRLEALLAELHRRGIAYVDLEKRENILVGDDGRPCLIDFQISWRWEGHNGRPRRGLQRLIPLALGRLLLAKLQSGDRYHLLKHRRRHRPDTLTAEQLAASYRRGWFIELHRRLSWPFTALRRGLLKRLTGRSRSAKQDGPEFVHPGGAAPRAGNARAEDGGVRHLSPS
ncbi:MAG: hypothetical protein AMXMBFR83_00770 [Phycisphaerae bacterium]